MEKLRSSALARRPRHTFSQRYWQQPEVRDLPPLSAAPLGSADAPHFSVFTRSEQLCQGDAEPARLGLYKLSFVTAGAGRFTYGPRTYDVQPNTLAFLHPHETWAWQATSQPQEGFFCLFNEAFLEHPTPVQQLRQHPHFRLGTTAPVLPLTAEQAATTRALFTKLRHECIMPGSAGQGAAAQLTYRFLTLLQQQFPIEQPDDRVQLRYPGQFAAALAVQSNHLNACVKATTGHSLRAHVQQHMLREAQSLLRYTAWPIGVIAAALGFEETPAFTHFFRKAVGCAPAAYRGAQKYDELRNSSSVSRKSEPA
jgi:AraC family transcriptional activator of pobA